MVISKDLDKLFRLIKESVIPLNNTIIKTKNASGRTLYENIFSKSDIPPFNRSMMDGYAVKHNAIKTNESYAVYKSIFAGDDLPKHNSSKPVIQISTGANIPNDFNTIIPIEYTTKVKHNLTFKKIPAKGSYIHLKGQDIKKNELLFSKGITLKPHHIGAIISCGVSSIKVSKKPKIKIITTGNEISKKIESSMILNSNEPMISAFVKQYGGLIENTIHIRDSQKMTRQTLQNISNADLLITTGGAGNGPRDYLIQEINKVAVPIIKNFKMKPGGPTSLWKLKNKKTYILTLAGNPFSALVGLHTVGRIVINSLLSNYSNFIQSADLTFKIKRNAKHMMLPIKIQDKNIYPITFSNSGDLIRPSNADGIAIIPPAEAKLKKVSYIDWR